MTGGNLGIPSNEEDIFLDEQNMYRFFTNERGDTGIAVLCGGTDMYEVKVLLNDEERCGYEAAGRQYLDRLAKDVARNSEKYDHRSFG